MEQGVEGGRSRGEVESNWLTWMYRLVEEIEYLVRTTQLLRTIWNM